MVSAKSKDCNGIVAAKKSTTCANTDVYGFVIERELGVLSEPDKPLGIGAAPITSMGGEYELDLVADLCPVVPSCARSSISAECIDLPRRIERVFKGFKDFEGFERAEQVRFVLHAQLPDVPQSEFVTLCGPRRDRAGARFTRHVQRASSNHADIHGELPRTLGRRKR
jgi:hypothetical protein